MFLFFLVLLRNIGMQRIAIGGGIGCFGDTFGADYHTGAHQVVLIPIVRGMVELENIFIDDYQ